MQIKFNDTEQFYNITSFRMIGGKLAVIKGTGLPENTNGFSLYRNGKKSADYSAFTVKYNVLTEVKSGILLSNNEEFIETEETPVNRYFRGVSEADERSLLMEAKVKEMNETQQAVIQQGIDVTLTDGTVEHFTLTGNDQTSLMGLQVQVAQGVELIPWHTSDQSEHCKFYSNEDMALITAAAMSYVTWHVTYFRDLRIYIRAIETKEEVEAVVYGMDIPAEYQSDPLKAMIAAQEV